MVGLRSFTVTGVMKQHKGDRKNERKRMRLWRLRDCGNQSAKKPNYRI